MDRIQDWRGTLSILSIRSNVSILSGLIQRCAFLASMAGSTISRSFSTSGVLPRP